MEQWSVDTGVRPSRPPQSHGAKRKISRLGKFSPDIITSTRLNLVGRSAAARPGVSSVQRTGLRESSSAGEPSGGKNSRTSASATNVTSAAPVTLNLAGSSLKRVDFSERLRLREVRWDGTIRDSVARPPPPPATSGENATFSVPATVADASVSARKGESAARLTHVQVEVPGGSGHEHAKGAQRGHEVVGVRDREDRVSSRGIVGGRGAASGHGGGDGGGAAFLSRDQPVGACANMINSDSERPTVRRDGGGEWGEAAGGPRGVIRGL
ncbi:hypothetical protein C0Q70_18046 [Pomacea canaliculata]|uniref:Uncharacterized protein n=1 Tax=Pomacea canaliculata TaxID=400727 RepID=A0A2T7NM53_POMCA|nr:hypothetical protein C0Q70_18046 [Pomacea canaliculata]